MAYPLDTAAQNAALDALLGGDSSGIPSAWEVALYDGHPLSGGAELTSAGGYVRASLNNDLTDFPAAASGLKTSVVVSFADATAAFSDSAPYAVFIDAADHSTRWFVVTLSEPVNVTAAGPVPPVVLSTYWNTN